MLPIIIAYQRRDSQPRPEYPIKAIMTFFFLLHMCLLVKVITFTERCLIQLSLCPNEFFGSLIVFLLKARKSVVCRQVHTQDLGSNFLFCKV